MSSSIAAAKLVSKKDHVVPGQLLVTEFFFQVPVSYENPSAGSIVLFGRRANKYESATPTKTDDGAGRENQKPYVVYLEGGPGFGNREPQDHSITRYFVNKGYQVLLLDHRGVGLSTPVSADFLASLQGGIESQFEWMSLMRQDNTVRDCEAVRKYLTQGWPANKAKWSTFGQSYGGFISLSYLSLHPEGLSEVFLTGGLAPVGRNADEVYRAVFPRVIRRNDQYYDKFPEDIENVRQVAAYIETQGGALPLPGGGFLTVPRLMTLGISFGTHGGFDQVHATVLQLKSSLDQFNFLTRSALTALEGFTPFDTNIIYAILHEAIYCDGPYASRWASDRVARTFEAFSWLKSDASVLTDDKPLYFCGENIFPFHFETYPELIPLQELAQKLADYDEWPPLYDTEQLKKNQVPVYAASYVDDMFVDNVFARETAELVRGTKVFETNVLYHNALRSKTDTVLQGLFSLRDDVLD